MKLECNTILDLDDQFNSGLASGLQTGTAWVHDLASGRRRLDVEAEEGEVILDRRQVLPEHLGWGSSPECGLRTD